MSLPQPLSAQQIMRNSPQANAKIMEAYMQAVWALANGKVVVTKDGVTLPAKAIKFVSDSAVIAIDV